jgi:hypothetical protein
MNTVQPCGRPPIICPRHMISLLHSLLGTHNPELIGVENIVLRVILRWNPLHGLRLAKIGEKRSVVEDGPANG